MLQGAQRERLAGRDVIIACVQDRELASKSSLARGLTQLARGQDLPDGPSTSELENVFNVRLVGSLEKRIEHIREIRGIGKKEAWALIRQEDRGRQRYLKKYFGKDIEDPLSYHLVVNTDSVPYEQAACLIGEAALEHLHARSKFADARFQTGGRNGVDQLLPEQDQRGLP